MVEQASGLPLTWDSDGPAGVPDTGRRRMRLVKRAMDVVLASAALVSLSPMLLIVALAIKATSRGPALFLQAREGLNGVPFTMIKFRSFEQDECDAMGTVQVVPEDRRVTSVGRFIRRTSIDELPQLLNVLRGEMSLVGPRPHVPGMRAGGTTYRALVPFYDRRLDVLPGITGWAQCKGLRGPTDDGVLARARIEHDVAYVQNLSIGLDLKIILLTIRDEFLVGSGK